MYTAAFLISASADVQEAPEYRIKANYVYNLATKEMIHWPDEAFPSKEAPFLIGILGRDPFGAELGIACRGRRAHDRPIKFKRSARIADLKDCQLVFVPRAQERDPRALAKALVGSKVLLVGETPGFARQGGMVNFYLEKGKLRFELNPDAALREGIQMRARLLQIGKIVRDQGR